MSDYKLVKNEFGKIVARFVDDVETIECDFCKRIVPIHYTERVFMNRDGYHDGRDGYYFYCKNVWKAFGGKIHSSCRG